MWTSLENSQDTEIKTCIHLEAAGTMALLIRTLGLRLVQNNVATYSGAWNDAILNLLV